MKGCTHFELNVNETSYEKTYSMMIYLGVMSAMLFGKFIFYPDLETECMMEKRYIITDELGIRILLLVFSLIIAKNMNSPISGLVFTENFSGLVVPSDDTL